jgi:hypothetical protein
MITLPRTAVRQWFPNCDTRVPIAVYEQIHLVLNFDTSASPKPHYTGRFIMFSVITNIYNKKAKGPTLMELFTATGKLKKVFFTTRDVRCVHHGWHGTHLYAIQVLATHASTWVHCSSEEYRCTHVDTCVARTWISYRCVPYHPWCTHRTSLVVKKTFSVFLWLWTIPLR